MKKQEMHVKCWLEILMGRYHMVDAGKGRSTILKWILMK